MKKIFKIFTMSLAKVFVSLLNTSRIDSIEHLILKGGGHTLSKTKSVLIEVDENFGLQVDKTNEYLTKGGFRLKEKLQSDLIKKSKFKSIFNQIWKKD